MEYKYLLEEKANNNLSFDDIANGKGNCILNIICYHVEEKYKYPFLQFMMEKIPYCNNIVKEQLIFPYIFIKNSSSDIRQLVLEKIKTCLDDILCCNNEIKEDMYKGIIFVDNYSKSYALINVTGLDISGLYFNKQTSNWFVLPSEIINNQNVLNIGVDKDVINIFTDFRQIGHLINTKNNKYYMLPDVVYTGCEKKQAEFKSIFGNVKTKTYNNCGEYYFFYRSFYDAVKDGGWLKEGEPDKIGDGDRIIVETISNKYLIGCINRYALFTEGKIFIENSKEFTLSDELIDKLYPEPCIIISYSGEHKINPDILVKDYRNFVCLSYHFLNNSLLDHYFMETNKKQYAIV
jgi:hypothetical protein